MDLEELAKDHLEELMVFLGEETEMSAEDIMNEVCMLVDNYRSELNLDATEQEKENIIHSVEEDDEEPEDSQDEELIKAFQKLSSTNFNRGFLLGKATDLYYKTVNLDADLFSALSPAEKVKHRKEITKVFNAMVIKEAAKPPKSHKISEHGGAIKRTRQGENIDINLDDGKTDAEIAFYQDKIKDLKKSVRLTKAELKEAERQSKIESVSSVIVSRNLDRIDELKELLEESEKELKFYQAKL